MVVSVFNMRLAALAAFTLFASNSWAAIREVKLQPSKIIQHVTDRAKAQDIGLCTVNDMKGALPDGKFWEETLRTSALVGFYQQGFKVDNSWAAKLKCQSARWEVMQMRVILTFDLQALPPAGKPFLAYLKFRHSAPDELSKKFDGKMHFPSPPELGTAATQKSAFLTGISVQKKGFLCYVTQAGSNHGLQFMYQYVKDNPKVAESGCGDMHFPAPSGEIVSVLRLPSGDYMANVAPLLMKARNEGQAKVNLILHGPTAPAGAASWPTVSASKVMGLEGWDLSVVSNACSWNSFPGSC
jgi:hypothetical protein